MCMVVVVAAVVLVRLSHAVLRSTLRGSAGEEEGSAGVASPRRTHNASQTRLPMEAHTPKEPALPQPFSSVYPCKGSADGALETGHRCVDVAHGSICFELEP